MINRHIETYLDYYCDLSHAPGFAVLLQGQWGSGKTWFINRYREKLKEKKQKCLYVSLYGMTSFSEIEDAFFQQLHPLLASKSMAITGKIFRGLLKGTLKIDLDNDSKDDGAWNMQVPEINLPDYLKDTGKSVLIFDDLERCKIDLSNMLGYINFFVEHQDMKVILVANEDELQKDSNYPPIKEKLIGKTFGVSLDFDGALENFITLVNNSDIIRFLSSNQGIIQDLCEKANYENLRNLKQIVFDFERIFEALPEKAKAEPEILLELLKFLMAFSIEIKRGAMFPKDIERLRTEYVSGLSKGIAKQTSNQREKDNLDELTPLQKVLRRYFFLNLYEPFPSTSWWQTFFDKGVLDVEELEQSILNSKYFQDENTPEWKRLWNYSDLTDENFKILLGEVEVKFRNREYTEVGVVKHIFGLFLLFSYVGIYNQSKEDLLEEAKSYIDHLKESNKLDLYSSSTDEGFGSYQRLGFQGNDLEEFRELSLYITEIKELAKRENMPIVGQDLLAIMLSNSMQFYRMICMSDYHDGDLAIKKYYDVPVLAYIEPSAFVENILLMGTEEKRTVFWALSSRYKLENNNQKLIEELEWLKTVRDLLQREIDNRNGELSGFILSQFVRNSLTDSITKLQKKPSEIQPD